MAWTVQVVGLKEFQRDLKLAIETNPRALTAALKAAGVPLVADLKGIPAHRSGALAGGYKTQVRGPVANIVNRVPYAAGAEWGVRGKWSGFQKYGARGRFAAKEVTDKAEEIVLAVYDGLKQIATVYGWAR
jgi:hypothetical protein